MYPAPPPKKKKRKKKGLSWLDWQSLDVKYVILTLCSFDSSLHCSEYSYISLLPRSGSCKNRNRLHLAFLQSWMLSLMKPRAKWAKVQRQLDFFFNKPLVRDNIVFVCKSYYFECLIKGLDINSNTYCNTTYKQLRSTKMKS